MFEAHRTLIMIPSEIRRSSEGLNDHGVIIVVSSEFGDTHYGEWRRSIVNSIFEVIEVKIAIIF